MGLTFDTKVFNDGVNKNLPSKRFIWICISITAFFLAIAIAIAIAYDGFSAHLDFRDLFKTNLAFWIFGILAFLPLGAILVALFATLITSLLSGLFAGRNSTTETPLSVNDKAEESGLLIDKIKPLFTDEWDQLEAFVRILEDNHQSFKKVDYGKVAVLIADKKERIINDKYYIHKSNGDEVINFSAFCKDFYEVFGCRSSTYGKWYYKNTTYSVRPLFKGII